MNSNSSLSADELRHVSGSLKRAHMSDHLATAVFYVVSGAFVLLLIAFTMYVVWGGIKAFRPEIFSFDANGIGNQFFNTVYLVFLSLVISVPIGIFAGVYMAEYAPEGRIIHALRIAIETLSSPFDRGRPFWLPGLYHHGRIPVEPLRRRFVGVRPVSAAYHCDNL